MGDALFETDVGDTGEHTGSFLYLSIPYYWVRELWLASRARHWQLMEATVESARRSLGGYKETIRLEIWYSYHFNEQQYSGRLVRDLGFTWGVSAALQRYPRGARVPVYVNPRVPDESYLPSGLGSVQPLLIGIVSLGSLALLLLIVIGGVLSLIFRP